MATIGSAVGIANIWRFSSIAGQSGGGAFLIPFFLAVVLFAFPLMLLEMGCGRRAHADVLTGFRQVAERFRVVGWFISLVIFALTAVYLVITGWTLAYLVFSLIGEMVTFGSFSMTMIPLGTFLVSLLITAAVVALGVRSGIENITTKLVPLSFVILAAMFIYSMTMDGFSQGIEYLFAADLGRLNDPDVWVAAFGQAFFSLAVGYGLIFTYASYMREETDIPRSAVLITSADVLVALISGIIIFSTVFTFDLQPTAGAELAFSTLPVAFDSMPFGYFMAIMFFFLLFTTALTSAVSMMEVNVATMINNLDLPRRKATAYLSAGLLVLGTFSALSYSALELRVFGENPLDFIDHVFGTFGIAIAAMFSSLVFSWCIGRSDLEREVDHRTTRFVVLLTRYFVPFVLLVVILASAYGPL